MGLIEKALTFLFGGGRNVVRETAEVFRENTEAGAARAAELQGQALAQLGAEYAQPQQGWFDRVMDGVNRLPRPALALGTLGLFVSAMVDPIWFASRMQGIALVPEPLWWLLGAIVSFYFGARHQQKGQQFQRQLSETLARVPRVIQNIERLEGMRGQGLETLPDAEIEALEEMADEANPALSDWRQNAHDAGGR